MIKKPLNLRYMRLEDAVAIAQRELLDADCDWAKASDVDWTGRNLYFENIFTLHTEAKPGQCALSPLPFYAGNNHRLIPGRDIYGGRVQFALGGKLMWVSGDKRYFDIAVKRREFRRWLRRAKTWNYLETI